MRRSLFVLLLATAPARADVTPPPSSVGASWMPRCHDAFARAETSLRRIQPAFADGRITIEDGMMFLELYYEGYPDAVLHLDFMPNALTDPGPWGEDRGQYDEVRGWHDRPGFREAYRLPSELAGATLRHARVVARRALDDCFAATAPPARRSTAAVVE